MLPFLFVLLDIPTTLKNLYTNLFLPALGGLMVIMLAYGGVLVMTSSASDDIRQQSKGKKVIIATIVGGAIVAIAGQIGVLLLTNFK